MIELKFMIDTESLLVTGLRAYSRINMRRDTGMSTFNSFLMASARLMFQKYMVLLPFRSMQAAAYVAIICFL